MELAEKFSELWNSTTNMVVFEARKLSAGGTRVKRKEISTYYNKNVLQNLWLADDFASEYRNWILEAGKFSNPMKNNVVEALRAVSFSSTTNNIFFKYTGIVAMIAAILSLSIGLAKCTIVAYLSVPVFIVSIILIILWRYKCEWITLDEIKSIMNKAKYTITQTIK